MFAEEGCVQWHSKGQAIVCGLAVVCAASRYVGSEFCCFCRIAVPVVAPSEVGGGGGTGRELIITWTVSEDFPIVKEE